MKMMIVILMMGMMLRKGEVGLKGWDLVLLHSMSPLSPCALAAGSSRCSSLTNREGEERLPISNKREDIRKARIESEQVCPLFPSTTSPFHPLLCSYTVMSCDLLLPSRTTRFARSARSAQTFGSNLKRQGADKSKRRRDELREGFRRLKEVLPATTQRSSKSSLLDRCEYFLPFRSPCTSLSLHLLLS